MAIKYRKRVHPRTLDLKTYTVSDSLYNFRFHPVSDLKDPSKRANRTITAVYTNNAAALEADRKSDRGKFVIIELNRRDLGGNTVMAWRNGVRVNPDLQTRVVTNETVYALKRKGKGRHHRVKLAKPSPKARGVTKPAINLLADDFVYKRFPTTSGVVVPYAYHLPQGYDASKKYPVVVILPGQGMGYMEDPADGANNEGVQVVADIPATAWQQSEWTETDEDVIVLTVQNPRTGSAGAQAAAMVEVLTAFSAEFSGVDQDRLYVSTVSYGSLLAWEALANNPGLFDAALITGGFPVTPAQAGLIAASETPIWITHGTNDHLLPAAFGQTSFNELWLAYTGSGKTPAQATAFVEYTEYPNSAFYEPDYHLAAAPTYEEEHILQWLLAQ